MLYSLNVYSSPSPFICLVSLIGLISRILSLSKCVSYLTIPLTIHTSSYYSLRKTRLYLFQYNNRCYLTSCCSLCRCNMRYDRRGRRHELQGPGEHREQRLDGHGAARRPALVPLRPALGQRREPGHQSGHQRKSHVRLKIFRPINKIYYKLHNYIHISCCKHTK